MKKIKLYNRDNFDVYFVEEFDFDGVGKFEGHLEGNFISIGIDYNEDGTEYVLGHSGSINIKGEELICFSEGKDVFRCNVYDAKVGELLSKDGVRLSMQKDDGSVYTVVAYYVYRR